MRGAVPRNLRAKLARIQLLLCDVDGVLTDASVILGADTELKQFNIRDGLGLVALRKQGIRVGWISSRPSEATTCRAEELKIDYLCQQKTGKVAVVSELLEETGLNWEEVCYVGDDVVDLGVMRRVGVAVAVADAVSEAQALAHYRTAAAGGRGAVREVVELILKAQGKWKAVVEAHLA